MRPVSLVISFAALVLSVSLASGQQSRDNQRATATAKTEDEHRASTPIAPLAEKLHPEEPAGHSTGETYNYYGDFNYRPKRSPDGVAIGVITAVLMVFLTGGLVYVGKKAADSARSSADAARDQLEITRLANEQQAKIAAQADEATKQSIKIAELALKSERPYILIDEIRIVGTEPPPARTGLANKTDAGDDRPPIACHVRFKNSGRGTARIIKIVGTVTFQKDWPEENVRGTQTQTIEKGALPAGETLSFDMIRDIRESLFLGRDEFNSLDVGDAKLIAFGSLLYGDVTGEQLYFTNFAWHFSPWPNMMRMFKNGTLEWHGEGSTDRGPDSLNRHN